MHKISHKDFSCILNMLESIQRIQEYSNKVLDPKNLALFKQCVIDSLIKQQILTALY